MANRRTQNPNGSWVTEVPRNVASELEDAGRRLRSSFVMRHQVHRQLRGGVRLDRGREDPDARSLAEGERVCERSVRTVREECLDHLFVFSRALLERILTEYVKRDNQARTHRGLQIVPPRSPTDVVRRRGPSTRRARRRDPRVRARRLIDGTTSGRPMCPSTPIGTRPLELSPQPVALRTGPICSRATSRYAFSVLQSKAA